VAEADGRKLDERSEEAVQVEVAVQ
jgi:hypothetical protein